MKAEQRRMAIERANKMLFDDTDDVKALHGKLLLSEVSISRCLQEVNKGNCTHLCVLKQLQTHVGLCAARSCGQFRAHRALQGSSWSRSRAFRKRRPICVLHCCCTPAAGLGTADPTTAVQFA